MQRFDRHVDEAGQVSRLHQIDLCQLLNRWAGYKYESEGGVTFEEAFRALDQTRQPAVSRNQLLRWLIFNYIVGNSDAHAKNIAFPTTMLPSPSTPRCSLRHPLRFFPCVPLRHRPVWECEVHHLEYGGYESFRLAQWLVKQQPQSNAGLDCQVRVIHLGPTLAILGWCPARDHVVVQPKGDAPGLSQSCLVFGPVLYLIPGLVPRMTVRLWFSAIDRLRFGQF